MAKHFGHHRAFVGHDIADTAGTNDENVIHRIAGLRGDANGPDWQGGRRHGLQSKRGRPPASGGLRRFLHRMALDSLQISCIQVEAPLS